MRSPAGHEFRHIYCHLEMIESPRLVVTSGLQPGLRHVVAASEATRADGHFEFAAVTSLALHGKCVRYSARVTHAAREVCRRPEQIHFQDGWGNALDQLMAPKK
jgi:hypothetical protein